jgi:Tfp pilus assembly protein PilF
MAAVSVQRRRRQARHEVLAAPAPSGQPASSRDWLRWAPLFAALVAFLVYAPSIGGGFIYDDGELILRNPAIRDLRNLRAILLYEPSRPVLTLTWALNYAAGGVVPWHYHLVNVLIHAGNAAILASLFLWMARRSNLAEPRQRALLCACLFAVSPMACETVAYVASRSSGLVTLLILASLRVAVSVLAGGPRWRLAVSLGLFLLALATKEEAAAAPLLLLLLDYFFIPEQKLSDMRRRLPIHAVALALVPLGLLARRAVTGTWLPPQVVPPGIYVLTQWAAFPLYFFRVLVPLDPAIYRLHRRAPWPVDASTAAFGLLTLSMVFLAVRYRHRWPRWSFAVACLAAGLLPSSSLLSLNEMVVDHRAYLGRFGIAFAVGNALWSLGRLRLAIPVLMLFAAGSVSYQWVLADPVRAWEDAVRRAPESADAWCALGESYAARGDPRAEAAFQGATRLDPTNYRYWANLGVYYSEKGRAQDAAAALQAAAQRAPREATVRDYLGQVLRGLGREDEAQAEFEAAIAANPAFAQAYINLAALFLKKGQADRARSLLETAAGLASNADEAQRIAELRRRLP